MRTIGVASVGRSDYGHLRPILRKIQEDPELSLALLVGGTHLSMIADDAFPIMAIVETPPQADTPAGIAKTIGAGVSGFAEAFASITIDILVVLGDRFEMHAAALAALPFKIPVAHIHGGEVTEGAIDDALRHSMTKLSHLHFVATAEYGRRVAQMGEESWRITISGAPSLDNLDHVRLFTREEMEGRFALCLQPPPLLVTFHPVTLEYEQAEWQA